MAKKRVHEIAKANDLSSKEVLAALKAAGVDAKVAASSVDEADAIKALAAAKGNGAKATTAEAPARRRRSQTGRRRARRGKTGRCSRGCAESRRCRGERTHFDQTGAPGRTAAGRRRRWRRKNAAS